MKEQVQVEQRNLADSFQPLLKDRELLEKIIDSFPYPIQIFSVDGTARMVNKAALEMIGIRSVESHVGIYNVFEDPVVIKLGFLDQVRQVLKGKTVYLTDFNAPYRDLIRYFNVVDRDIQTISSDITCFPLLNDDGEVEYFVAIFIIKKIYRGKDEIAWGKQYIETHWLEPFDLGETAKAACLSKVQFAKLFKKHTGITPHEYYVNYKISKLKEKLMDTNLSIAQAFSECNLNYNGHFVKMFKKKVGVSPSAYRKMTVQNE
ncbi:MAG: helix-turn-helix domain-containing protein [Clostridiales bacterium]|nr:helix-turn-helix domain-containing protein [Clostridiales bacterium]